MSRTLFFSDTKILFCGVLNWEGGHPRMGIGTGKKVLKSPGKSVRKKVYLSPIGGLAKKNTRIYAVHMPIVK